MNRLNFSKYTQKDRVKREMQETIKVYNDLSPKMELYTFNDGVQRNLASLIGTIKVFYVNQTYNIPICVHLTEAHPYQAPVVFVRPTATMEIKQNKTVDLQGRVYIAYLTDWNANSSDLQSLLSILQIEFGENMPVFSRTTKSPSYPPATNQQPYYPGGGYPSYPVQNSHGIGSGWTNPATTQYPVTTTTPYMPSSNNTPSYYPQPTTVNSNIMKSSDNDSMNAINDDVLKMSILSAVEDKVRRFNKDIFAQQSAELEVLETTNKELVRGSETITKMFSDIEQERVNIERVRRQLEEENDTMKATLSTCEKESDVGINYDEVVEGSAPLYRQLFNLYVEEQSLEDVFYFLGEAIGRGVIDIDAFLKKVRELSRRQFMLRATIKKCREKAGLPEV